MRFTTAPDPAAPAAPGGYHYAGSTIVAGVVVRYVYAADDPTMRAEYWPGRHTHPRWRYLRESGGIFLPVEVAS